MFGFLPLVIQGLGWGFLAGVSIGPFLGYVINVVLIRGWRRSLGLIVIPVLVDIPIILVFLHVLRGMPEFIVDAMSIIGGAFVLWLSWSTWKDNRRIQTYRTSTTSTQEIPKSQVAFRGVFLRGLLVNALNPAPYLFWSTVSGPRLVRGIQDGGIGYALAFLIAYYAVFLSLIFGLMLVVDRLGELDDRINRYLLPVTIVLMFILGIGLVGTGLLELVVRMVA